MDNKPWYLEPYVWLIIAFPLTAVIGGIITLVLAIETNDGLVVDDYYNKGLAINRTLDRDRMAKHYGLSADLQFAKDNKQIRLFLGSNNKFIYPNRITIKYLNASRGGMDKQGILIKNGDTGYLGKNPQLQRGKWDILIESGNWRLLKVIHIP